MKKFYLSVLAVLACIISFAANITTNTTGNWTNTAIWTINGNPAGRIPINGDVISILSAAVVTLDNATVNNLSNVQLDISGKLILNNKTTLALTFSSITLSAPNGSITRQNTNQDVTVSNATIFSSSGTKVMNAPFSSGTYVALPVKFTGFSLARQNSDVLVQWSTAEEVNADSYIIERSTDGNNWTGITTVAAKGNSSSLTNYTYVDKNVTTAIAYYRVKQVDIDGKYTYTTTRAIKAGAAAVDVKVAAINNRVVLQFSNEVKGAVEVRLVTLGGQGVSREVLHEPVGQVILSSTPAKGSYVVSVSNAQDIHVAKQVRF